MCLSGFREAIIIVFEYFLETKKVDSQTLIMQEGGKVMDWEMMGVG